VGLPAILIIHSDHHSARRSVENPRSVRQRPLVTSLVLPSTETETQTNVQQRRLRSVISSTWISTCRMLYLIGAGPSNGAIAAHLAVKLSVSGAAGQDDMSEQSPAVIIIILHSNHQSARAVCIDPALVLRGRTICTCQSNRQRHLLSRQSHPI
jgi:hypothetical protein